MDKIMDIYNKIRRDNKLLTLTMSVLVACLLAVIVAFVCMPDAKAASINEVTWSESEPGVYNLGDLADGSGGTVNLSTISVGSGASITINGTNKTKSNVSIVINYTGNTGSATSPAKVYVNLNNVNIAQTLDCAAIRFSTDGNPVDYIVTVDGNNLITSSCTGAKTPLVAVESVTYKLYKLKNNLNGTKAEDYVDVSRMSKLVNLVICGESADDTLKLSNGAGSYGALIGSGEVASFAAESQQVLQKYIDTLNKGGVGEQIFISKTEIRKELLEKYGYEELSPATYYPEYKIASSEGTSAGKITIGGNDGSKPLVLILNNAGSGAAVGGGSNAGTRTDKVKGADADKITINSGTITFKSTGTVAPVFGSSYLVGSQDIAATYGAFEGIEINGGSLFFNNYENKFGNQNPVNKEGKKLYEIKATNNDLKNLTSKNDNDPLKLKYTYDSSLSVGIDLDKSTTSKVKDISTAKVADVAIALTPTVTYSYLGEGHGGDSLYFYIPAIQTTKFTIKDEFGLGYTKFIVKDANGSVVDPVSADENSPDSRSYILVRDKIYYLSATNIPSGLTVKDVSLSTGKKATYNKSKGYQISADEVKIEAEVTYGGTIDVVYNNGLLSADKGNHKVDMPSDDYEYGTESFALNDLGTIYKNCTVGGAVEDLIFDRWVYTDKDGNELGNITHIVKKQSTDGNKRVYSDIAQDDGKIYVKAKWKVKVDFVLGNNATYEGNLPVAEVEYAYGEGNIISVTLPEEMPVREAFNFLGWTLDDGKEMYNYSQALGSINEVLVSSCTSHRFYANYERSDFCVYIDESVLDEKYATVTCLDDNGAELLAKNDDGTLATLVVDGKTYYYTDGLEQGTNVRIIVKTKHGYMMENTSVKITGSASSDFSSDNQTGECTVDVVIEIQDVYVTTNARFNPVQYEMLFKDGKEPNEVLWGGTKFYYDIEDILENKTIGDIIREGLGDLSMSDEDIVARINSISKNDRFSEFDGLILLLYEEALGLDKTISSIYAENPSLTYGDMVFTADWMEYEKYTINMNLLQRIYNSEGGYNDVTTEDLVAVLYYCNDGENKELAYTDVIVDLETGEEQPVVYAKAGDKIEIALHRVNSKGNPIGEPLVTGIEFEELYYKYTSKLNESVRAEIKDDTKSFTVKDDVSNQTTIDVYMTFSLKKYNIVYWDLRGFDNSLNPSTYTIFDVVEFVPITEGVDWLLVCPDEDDTNNDDIATEVIHGIEEDGKLLTDGNAGKRDYVSNLILKPDWSQYEEDSYAINIDIDDDAYGTVEIMFPADSSEFFINDMILLSVKPAKGYKLVKNSLVYKKDTITTYSSLRTNFLNKKELNEVIIPVVDEESGIYMITMPDSDIVVSALFELCQYEIVYSDVPDGVINNNPDSYNVNSDIELIEPVRDGYTFLGWYDVEGNRVTKIIDRTGNLVLIPKFELIPEALPDEPDTPGETDIPDEDETKDNPNGSQDSENTDKLDDVEKPEDSEKPGDVEKPEDSEKPSDSTKPDNTEKPDKPSKPENKPSGDKGEVDVNGGNSGNTSNSVTITGRPSNVVSRPVIENTEAIIKPGTNNQNQNLNQNQNSGIAGGQIQAGDKTDIPKLGLICAGAVLILLIFAFKRPSDKDDEE